MEEGTDKSRFACSNCGKQYAWDAKAIGRSFRCKCGAAVKVPLLPDAFAADRGTYDVNVPQAKVTGKAAGQRAVPAAPRANVLTYADGTAEASGGGFLDSFADPVRELYVPGAMLVAGVLMLVALVFAEAHHPLKAFGTLTTAGLISIAGVLVGMKTAVTWGLAAVVKRSADVNMRKFRSAALKSIGIAVFIVAMALWSQAILPTDVWIRVGGGGGRFLGRGGPYFVPTGLPLVPVMALLTFGVLYFLMDPNSEEEDGKTTWNYIWAVVLALLLIDVAAAICLREYAKPSPVMPPAAVAGTTGAGATAGVSAADAAIAARIYAGQNQMMVYEGNDWKNSVMGMNDRVNGRLVDMLYLLGADKVYVDILSKQTTHALKLYIQLPSDPAKRKRCVDFIDKLNERGNATPTTAPAGKYLEVDVPTR